MKILIFGGKGWIGKQFIEIMKKENLEFTIGKSRVDNQDSLLNEINEYNPTHIISLLEELMVRLIIKYIFYY